MERVSESEQILLPSPKEPMAVARRFVGEYWLDGDNPILRAWRGGWWRWSRHHWLEVEHRDVREQAYRFTENAVYEVVTAKGKTVYEPWQPNRHKIADLLEALAAVVHTEGIDMPAWLQPGPVPADEIVACTNGLLHVPTRRLLPHTPTYFNQVAAAFAYRAEAPAPTRWLTFLEELWPDDPESVAALQEFFGYVISGRINLHKILLLVGPTRSGKGTVARVLKALVGKGNHCGPTLASLGTNFGLSPLIGKPLAILSDARLGSANVHQVVERLLSVSGEDMLTVDRKYREPWTGTLPTRFLVISNELPRFGDASGAIAGRFIVLVLNESWYGREDPALTEQLYSELPGVFSWALDGLERLNKTDRFTEPQSSVDAIVALQDLVSPVAAFVRQECTRGPHEVPLDDLWTAWKAWAEENGHHHGSKQSFERDLRAVIPGLRVVQPGAGDNRPRVYRGLTLSGIHNGEARVRSRAPGSEEGLRTQTHASAAIVGLGKNGLRQVVIDRVDDAVHVAWRVVDVETGESLRDGWAGNGRGRAPGLFAGQAEARAWIEEHPESLEEVPF